MNSPSQRSRLSSIAVLFASLLSSRPAIAADAEPLRPVSFPSLSLAKARTFAADFYVDDRDRDPWGIDVFDIGFRFRYKSGDRTEWFVNAIADRAIALPEAPAIPSSPRDLIFLGPSRVIPSVFPGEHPYLDKRGQERVDAFIPGLATLGFARTMRTEGLAVGFSVAIAIPLAGNLNALRSGANSGRPDGIFAVMAARDFLGGKAHGRVGFTVPGQGSWPDRSFAVSGNTVEVTQTHPPIGKRLDAGLAWIRPLTDSLALTIESRTTKEFVGEERIDAITPVDAMVGIHKSFSRFDLSATLLNHFRPLPSGALRSNPLAGAVDLSEVAFLDRNAFLARVGLGAAAGQVRDGAHIVAIGVPTTALPPGAVVIAPTYHIRSEHNLGYIFTLTFRP
ncbi:MAG: hypothetical protein ABI565_10555 [Vicinamibacteria bacterium]